MSKVQIKLDIPGLQALRNSDEVTSMCQSVAGQVQAKCGMGYATSTHHGTGRVNVSIYPSSRHAKRSNYKHNTLLKALKSSKGE